MAVCSPFQEGKPLFMVVYVTVALGIVFSSLFILSALYSSPSKPFYSFGSWLSSSSSSPPRPHRNSSKPFWHFAWFCSKVLKFRFLVPFADVDTIVLNNSVNMNPHFQQDRRFTGGIWDVPVRTKMPDLKEFRLTKEIVEKHTKDNVIIVTFGNYAFMDFILNWVRHLTDLNVFNLLVGKLLQAFFFRFVLKHGLMVGNVW